MLYTLSAQVGFSRTHVSHFFSRFRSQQEVEIIWSFGLDVACTYLPSREREWDGIGGKGRCDLSKGMGRKDAKMYRRQVASTDTLNGKG